MSSNQSAERVAAKLRQLAAGLDRESLDRVLLQAVEPIRRNVIANVHSITGKTVSAVEVGVGKGEQASAHVTVDKRIAEKAGFPYPEAVESGHGGPHAAPPHPFFESAVDRSLPEVLEIAEQGIRDLIRNNING